MDRTLSLETAAWPDVERTGADVLLVVPLGSCEQHGPHLPFTVDTSIAAAVTAGLHLPDRAVVVAPALSYGASGEHQDFPGTLSLGPTALTAVLVELGRSASCWADRLLFVNGHGGNVEALVTAVAQLRGEGRDVAWWACIAPEADAHAGATETSLMLAIRPLAVRWESAEMGNPSPVDVLMPSLRTRGVRAVTANGVLGDPRTADAADGRRLITDLRSRLRAALPAWRVAADGQLHAVRLTVATR